MFDYHPCAIVGLCVLPRATPSSTLFATAGADGLLRVWDYGKRRLVCKREFPKTPRLTAPSLLSAAKSATLDEEVESQVYVPCPRAPSGR